MSILLKHNINTNSKLYKLKKKEEKKAEKIRAIIRNNIKYSELLNNYSDLTGQYDEDNGFLWEEDVDTIQYYGLECNGGATRYVIIDKDKNTKYILKNNYSSMMIYNDDDQCMDYENYENDYCEDEIKLRDDILAAYPLLAPLFLSLIPCGDAYIQEKAVSLVDSEKYNEYQSTKFLDGLKNDNEFFAIMEQAEPVRYNKYLEEGHTDVELAEYTLGYNFCWYYDVYKFYGKKIFICLMEVIDEFSLTDLRDANIGFSKINGRPVLMDYVGYHED